MKIGLKEFPFGNKKNEECNIQSSIKSLNNIKNVLASNLPIWEDQLLFIAKTLGEVKILMIPELKKIKEQNSKYLLLFWDINYFSRENRFFNSASITVFYKEISERLK